MAESERTKSRGVIGTRRGRVDGPDQVSGRARYADDIAPPRLLTGLILRSPHAHARIRSVDTTAARALPGVHALITGADLPTRYGIIPWTQDETALAVDKVRHVGDAVAAVAAVDERTARAALDLVRVDYEVLAPLPTVEEALAAGAPAIHDEIDPKTNVHKHVSLSFGDFDRVMADSDVVLEGDFYFPNTTHVAMEPHCAIGEWEPAGVLTVTSSTQVPHYLHRELARVLGVPADRVRVIQPAVGGGFGGKSEPFDLEFCVGKLAMLTGRPVKILYTREDVFWAHRGRHAMQIHQRLGARSDGTLTALDAKTVIDGGAYSSFGLVTTYYSGQLIPAPCRLQAYRFDSTRIYTTKPACGPKRGHGSVQPRFAFEVMLDRLAEKLGLDPIDLRRRNLLEPGERTLNGLLVRSIGMAECLDRVEAMSGWKQKHRRLPRGRGIGVATSFYISGTNYPIYPNEMPQSAVQLRADRSGRVTVMCGTSDIGQGAGTVLAMLVSEELGVDVGSVRVVLSDTDLTPVDLGAYSSRITLMAGNACLHAARSIADLVRNSVARRWECWASNVVLAEGNALHNAGIRPPMPIAEAFQAAETDHGTLGSVGHYNTPRDNHENYRGGTIGASPAYSFTAHIAEVVVDEQTGKLRVDGMWIAHDAGRALNPLLVEGQIEGCASMALGEVLMEEQRFHPSGLHRGPSLLDYRIPTSLDGPDRMGVAIVESLDPMGPLGAKEAGEGPLHSAIPAVANAIHDAVGIRVNTLPFSAPRILALLAEQEGRSAAAAF